MINRRRLLSTLFSLAGLAVLLSACKHRPSVSGQSQEKSDNGANGGGGY